MFDQSPNVAIYPSGDVIYKQRMGMEKPPRFYRARLTQAQRDDLKHRLKALGSLKPSYFVASGACVPDETIQWRDEQGTLRQVEVSGVIEPKLAAIDRTRTPPAFLAVYDQVVEFQSANAVPYEPERTRVIFAPVRGPMADPIPWPQSWATPVSSGEDEYLHADLSGLRFDEIYNWIQTRHDRGQDVTSDGKGYYNFIEALFPGDPSQLPSPEPVFPEE
ncbi:hypothetical protein KH5H1_29180 [Corallococcus caeni]|uniref:hypothetical protein n=1 Tax=Corallococcus caeni TaxID=3082388 RepID=UPI002957776B|nr:hypothetical protein KH5H1_29180 [Corallococcus sp. KH5-1]